MKLQNREYWIEKLKNKEVKQVPISLTKAERKEVYKFLTSKV